MNLKHPNFENFCSHYSVVNYFCQKAIQWQLYDFLAKEKNVITSIYVNVFLFHSTQAALSSFSEELNPSSRQILQADWRGDRCFALKHPGVSGKNATYHSAFTLISKLACQWLSVLFHFKLENSGIVLSFFFHVECYAFWCL